MTERELNEVDPFDAGFVDPDEARSERKEKKRKRRSPVAMAVAMLARREHSQAELVRKLMLKEVSEEDAKKAVEYLAEQNFQSDKRFLESRVRVRLSSGHGPNRAQIDLAHHGLDETSIEHEVDASDGKWQDAAYDLIERRFGPSPLPMDVQNKAFGLLVRRGFTFDQAWAAIRQPRPEADGEL